MNEYDDTRNQSHINAKRDQRFYFPRVHLITSVCNELPSWITEFSGT